MRKGQKKDFARRLRRTMTDAEHLLWRRLRSRELVGHKFRRQHPVGPYVADFVCLELKLIVELDGGQHQGCERDAWRDGYLNEQDFTVLRFWNNDVLMRTDAVLEAILGALAPIGPHPNPSPAGGRGA